LVRACYVSQFHEFDVGDEDVVAEEKQKNKNLLLTNK
jgi:hypothetical protein